MTLQAHSISLPSGARQLDGYLAQPDDGGARPGVVVIHEAYGLNENIKDITRRFAGAGYAALAVDLFGQGNRAVCMARLFAGMFANSRGHSGIRDLKAALTYLSMQQDVDAARLGAIGFCLGGGLAIAWACADDRLKAIAPFYGTNPRPFSAVARLCPVVGSYPGRDFTTSGGRKLDAALDQYGVPHDIKVYPGTRHSFFNDQSRGYDAAASHDSWQRVLQFFGQHLGREPAVGNG